MAYTDFANVVAPSFWDEAQSGLVVGGIGGSSALAGAILEVTDSLASRWDGTRYEVFVPAVPDDPETPEDDSVAAFYSRFSIVLVAPGDTLLRCSELFVEAITDAGDAPSVTFFGTDGEVLDDPVDPLRTSYLLSGVDTGEVAIEESEVGGDNVFRRVFRIVRGDYVPIDPNEPVVLDGIKAIQIQGFFGFPQGVPKRLYGIYGLEISGETAFWKDFSGQSDSGLGLGLGPRWPFQGRRLTERF